MLLFLKHCYQVFFLKPSIFPLKKKQQQKEIDLIHRINSEITNEYDWKDIRVIILIEH